MSAPKTISQRSDRVSLFIKFNIFLFLMCTLKCLEEGSLVIFYVGVSAYFIFLLESQVRKKLYPVETQLITLGLLRSLCN